MQIIGETTTPPGASSIGRSGPKTRSHKRLRIVDESKEEETFSSRLVRKKAKVYASPKPPNVE